uniref:Uncharacterized protein n=1 Tax=Anguilla anguilla TaxID=7936 RepID=A0A0E9VI55_ANGAN
MALTAEVLSFLKNAWPCFCDIACLEQKWRRFVCRCVVTDYLTVA